MAARLSRPLAGASLAVHPAFLVEAHLDGHLEITGRCTPPLAEHRHGMVGMAGVRDTDQALITGNAVGRIASVPGWWGLRHWYFCQPAVD